MTNSAPPPAVPGYPDPGRPDPLDPDLEHDYVDRAVARLREVTGYDAQDVTYAAGTVGVDAAVLMQLLDQADRASTDPAAAADPAVPRTGEGRANRGPARRRRLAWAMSVVALAANAVCVVALVRTMRLDDSALDAGAAGAFDTAAARLADADRWAAWLQYAWVIAVVSTAVSMSCWFIDRAIRTQLRHDGEPVTARPGTTGPAPDPT